MVVCQKLLELGWDLQYDPDIAPLDYQLVCSNQNFLNNKIFNDVIDAQKLMNASVYMCL